MSDPQDGSRDPLSMALADFRSNAANLNQDATRVVTAACRLDGRREGRDIRSLHAPLQELLADTNRVLRRVEQEMYRLEIDGADDMPKSVISDHAERLKEQYDGPVLNLALMLLERNRTEWLYLKPETNGADAVRRHGLTENQRSWMNDLQAAWEAFDGGVGQ